MKIIGVLLPVYFLLSSFCPIPMDMNSGAEMQNCTMEECMAESPVYSIDVSFVEPSPPVKGSSSIISFGFLSEQLYMDPFLIDRSPPGSSLSRNIQTTVLRI